MAPYEKQWEFLKNTFESGKMSHAYLLSGPKGTGKFLFTKEFIKFINCTSQKKPCQTCVNCKLIDQETFADLRIVRSINSESSLKNEKDSMEIDIAQIKEMNHFLGYKSYYGGCKTVIIEQADRMNVEAQSCLLKTLEEPKGKTVIFLISSKPETLLATILSRCQTIPFFPLQAHQTSDQEKKILQELLPVLSGQLAAKFQYAKKVNLDGDNFNKMLEVLERYFRNIMLAKIGVVKETVPAHIQNYSVEKIKHIIRFIETLHQQISTTNASAKLALEILLIEIS